MPPRSFVRWAIFHRGHGPETITFICIPITCTHRAAACLTLSIFRWGQFLVVVVFKTGTSRGRPVIRVLANTVWESPGVSLLVPLSKSGLPHSMWSSFRRSGHVQPRTHSEPRLIWNAWTWPC